jgi:hypothetical protein
MCVCAGSAPALAGSTEKAIVAETYVPVAGRGAAL